MVSVIFVEAFGKLYFYGNAEVFKNSQIYNHHLIYGCAKLCVKVKAFGSLETFTMMTGFA
ncbi:hypothetical protein [Bartonella rattaustraliani]|uniref:hypothetical protein n=1 Tax=Bartonella rattaustraliani TaxID=481139 RepID=UPI0012EAF4FE|nr:hypothetical protein [Bartonella rattaustraliani]